MEKLNLYGSIAAKLRDDILSGTYRPGDLLPSENELAQKYGISRGTARQSLQLLEREGMIRSAQGKGYFVCRPAHGRFVMEFREGGSLDPRYQQITVDAPPPHIRDALSLAQGQPVVIIRKTLIRDGRPVAYDEKFIPYEKGTPCVEQELHFAELPEMLAARYNTANIRTDMTIDAAPAPHYVCGALGLPPDTVLLTVSRFIRTGEGACVGCGLQYLTPAYGGLSAAARSYPEG